MSEEGLKKKLEEKLTDWFADDSILDIQEIKHPKIRMGRPQISLVVNHPKLAENILSLFKETIKKAKPELGNTDSECRDKDCTCDMREVNNFEQALLKEIGGE